MNTVVLPSELYKVNVELQQHVLKLLQESGRSWVEIVQQFNTCALPDFIVQTDDRFRATDWSSLIALPSEAFWPAFQRRLSDMQAINQIILKNQVSFATGFQQALWNWHHSVFDALSNVVEAGDLFRQWGMPWSHDMTTSASKAGK